MGFTTGFEQQHLIVRISAQTIRQHAAGRSGADDDVVIMVDGVVGFCSHCFSSVVLGAACADWVIAEFHRRDELHQRPCFRCCQHIE